MAQIVIIGAGPVGLHLALKLLAKGIAPEQLKIYDPRAGFYTRPGHITADIFDAVYADLGFVQTRNTSGHIKELERELYQMLLEKGAHIEQKRFKRFTKNKALIINDEAGKKELINCDYLFDCSGTERKVVKQVNRHCKKNGEHQVFSSTALSDVRIKKHYLAYVKLPSQDAALMENLDSSELAKQPEQYIHLIQTLRDDFSWQYYDYPIAYGEYFGKNKFCLYSEFPDDCPEEKGLKWMETVFAGLTGDPDFKIEELSPSKKWGYKPRLQTFKINPCVINRAYFSGQGFPNIFICGDAYIEPNYRLAHGVDSAVTRNKHLVDAMTVRDGRIDDINLVDYSYHVQIENQRFQRDIRQHYFNREIKLFKNTSQAGNAIGLFSQTRSLTQFEVKMHEEAQQLKACYQAELDLNQYLYYQSSCLELLADGRVKNAEQLIQAQDHLIDLYNLLPDDFSEKAKMHQLLLDMVFLWKNTADEQMNLDEYSLATKSLYNALSIFNHFSDDYQFMLKMSLYQTLIDCQRQLHEYGEGFETGKTALGILSAYTSGRNKEPHQLKLKYNMALLILDWTDFNNEAQREEAQALLKQLMTDLNESKRNVLFPSVLNTLNERFKAYGAEHDLDLTLI